jgi:hypothetical protein
MPKDAWHVCLAGKTGSERRAVKVTRLTDAVEKVFFGWSTKILKTADALRALRLEDPHRFTQKRPTAFILAPEYLAAAAVSKKRLSRDFRCLSIFDFFDSIDPTRTFNTARPKPRD